MRKSLVLWAFFPLILSVCSCGKEKINGKSFSPDGLYLAYFTDRPCFDGPCHTLYLQNTKTKQVFHLLELADDSDWCSEVLWHPKGTQVAFLVQRKFLYIFNIAALSRHDTLDLIPGSENGGYPPNPAAFQVQFSPDGQTILFKKANAQANFTELKNNPDFESVPYELNPPSPDR